MCISTCLNWKARRTILHINRKVYSVARVAAVFYLGPLCNICYRYKIINTSIYNAIHMCFPNIVHQVLILHAQYRKSLFINP